MAGDEQIRPQVVQSRQAVELTAAESWRLLGSVSLGRVVFTMKAMPAIRPVNHLIDDEAIIVRSHLGRRSRGMPRPVTARLSATRPTTWTRSGIPDGA